MNGPQHYAEAERLGRIALEELASLSNKDVTALEIQGRGLSISAISAQAQVHATLAQAAATIDLARVQASMSEGLGWEPVEPWTEALEQDRSAGPADRRS